MATTGFRLSGITIDCLDPHLVAQFWAGLLGGEPQASLPGWYELGERGRPRINFQPVREPKTVKTRIHLDLTVEDLDRAVEAVVQRWAGRPVNGTTGVAVAGAASWSSPPRGTRPRAAVGA